jgi:hypothetical protein
MFVLATLKELQFATLDVLPFFILSSARVSALVNVLSESPYESFGKWETCLIMKEDRSLLRVLLEHL